MNTNESWERRKGESSRAFGAFCAFRDYGPERTIKGVLRSIMPDEAVAKRKYRVWRNWASFYQWTKRVTDYENFLDKMNLAKQLERAGERREEYLQASAKILTAVVNKVETMDKEELKQAFVTDWFKTALQTEMELLGIAGEKGGKEQSRPIEVKFDHPFEGLCKTTEDE